MVSSEQKTDYPETPRQFYAARIDEHQSYLETLQRQSTWMSRLRGLTFLPAAAMAVYGAVSAANPWPWYTLAAILFAAFIAICTIHEVILRRASEVRHRRSMNRIQLARLDRRWRDIPVPEVAAPERHQPVSRDLDLFGNSSVFQLVSLAHTPWGQETLRDWLLEPAAADQIEERQQAVSILAADLGFREDLDLRGRQLVASETGPEAFVRWAESPPWLARRPWLIWLTRGLATAALATAIVAFSGWVETVTGWTMFLGVVLVNLAVNFLFVGKVYEIFGNVSSRSHDIQHYRPLLEEIAELPKGCTFFDRLKSKMGRTSHEPIQLLGSLTRIIRFANLRRDGLIGIPYVFSQLIFLTDFHVLCVLERWQQRHGHVVRDWLQSVAQLEAISSLATLAHDHPDWTMPVVSDAAETTIKSKSLN